MEAFVNYVSAELLPPSCCISTTTQHAVVYSWGPVVELPVASRIGVGAIIISLSFLLDFLLGLSGVARQEKRLGVSQWLEKSLTKLCLQEEDHELEEVRCKHEFVLPLLTS